ncbi:hypothetical protein Tco_0559375 [Tanacetum coccineum]
MEEMLYKFIEEGKREHEEMRAFICDFQTTNEILFKERNNSLIELRFGVQELLKVINNTPIIDCEVKGVTARGGKTMTQDAQNNDTNVHTEEPLAVNHNEPVESNEEKEEAQQKKFLENLKRLHINLPFIKALAQMSKYAKFLKSLLTNKARLEEACTITMNDRCSAVLLNKLPSKEKDLGSFTIPCDIGQLHINNALADLGASIKAQKLLANEKLDSFLTRGQEKSIDQSDLEGCEPVKYKPDNDSDSYEPIRRIASINMSYLVVQETAKPIEVEREHLYSASANEIDEKKPELKDLPYHLEYAYLHGDKSFPIIISSELSDKEKVSLLQVLEK